LAASHVCKEQASCLLGGRHQFQLMQPRINEVSLNVLVQAQGTHFLADIQTMEFVTKVLEYCKFSSQLLMRLVVSLHYCSSESM